MMGLQLRPAMAPALDSSASNMDGTSTSAVWEQVANEIWLSESNTRNAKPEVIKSRVWDPLEAEAFSWRSLAFLESLQILER
jgi:intron-binding protein aquarius